MKDYDPNDAIDFIFKTAPAYAKAKGELAELEAFKSSLKAIKMSESSEQSLGAQEREAYRSEAYQNLCKAIGCLLYTSPSPRDRQKSRMPSSA